MHPAIWSVAKPALSLWESESRKVVVLYIALFVVFGFVFLIPVGIAVSGGDGSRGRWDSILNQSQGETRMNGG